MGNEFQENMPKQKGYCNYCKIYLTCPWFCNNHSDNDNPIKEPCWNREYIDTDIEIKKEGKL